MLGYEVVELWARCPTLSRVEPQSVLRRPAVDEHSDIPVAEYGLRLPFLKHKYECM